MGTIVKNIIPADSRKNTTGKPQTTYTLRYRDSLGKQREKTFRTKREAEAYNTDETKAKQYGEDVNLTSGRLSFTEACEKWLATAAIGIDRTRETYTANYRANVKAVYATLSVKEAASNRQVAETLLNVTMASKSLGTRRMARFIIVSVLNALVVNGTIASHRLTDIKLSQRTVTEDESEATGFVHITDEQVKALAERCGIFVWLQRTMGLRIAEALGVEKKDFTEDGTTLRLRWQATRDGRNRVALKKRNDGKGRDIPVPVFVQKMIADLPDGPLSPGRSTTYRQYTTVADCFSKAVKAIGIEGLTSHSLRHMFATDSLANGWNIADLSEILGHKDAATTLSTYVHPSANAQESARVAMDARWS